jgi:pimeloyl-ACP methyl ester carboxylesterase
VLKTNLETLSNRHRVRVARLGLGANRSSRSPLVFLHGYPDNLQIWSEVATRLSKEIQIIAFDWPGMGYSDDWKNEMGGVQDGVQDGVTPYHMAGRLLALLDEWGIEKASLVGMDMGGQPALVFASMYPERVERLVVMNCLAFSDEKTSWEINLLRKFKWNQSVIRWFPRTVFNRAERTFLAKGVRLPGRLHEDLWGAFRQRPVREFITRMSAGYQATLAELPGLYPTVACPTLILWGGQDKHFPPAHARRLHANMRGSHLHVIPGAEHWMSWYLPGEVAWWIGNFLS